MMGLGTGASLLGGITIAGYLDAKFHLQKDLWDMMRSKKARRRYASAVAHNRGNPWFIFLKTVKRYPDMTCLWTREKSYSYQQLQDHSCQYAHFFLSQGVKYGELVAVYLQNREEFMVVWLALWSIGCAPAAININLTGDALIHCLKTSDSHILLADDDPTCRAHLQKCQDNIVRDLKMKPLTLDGSLKKHITTLPTTLPSSDLGESVAGEFPAILLHTSGTTGMPKSCAFTMSRLYISLLVHQSAMGDQPGPNGDRWYSCMPLYHGTSAITMMSCLAMGVSIAIGPRFSVRGFWTDIRDSEATGFVYVGEIIRYLLTLPPSPQDRNHKIRCIYGNGLRPDVWEQFRVRFGVPEVAEFFSSTEGVFRLFNYNGGPFTAGCVGHHGLIMRGLLHNVFVPVAVDAETGHVLRCPRSGYAIRLSHEQGGEILVSIPGESAFQGYWKDSAATQKKFIRNVFKQGDLYYRTGDALRRQGDGRWYFLDRLGDTFRWKSENVSTAEVSEIIGQFPGISEVNVYGVRLPNHEGRAGCAAIQMVSNTGDAFDYKALARFARSRLPRYAVPLFLRVVNNPTHTHNYKQNKIPLRKEGVDPALIGTEVCNGAEDRFLWIAPGEEHYSQYRKEHWHRLSDGRARF